MARRLILQDFLPYLLNRAGMKIGLMFSRDVEPYGVTLPMWRVLIELWHKGDHRLGELADRTSIDMSTLSRLLVVMQRNKLIVRRRSGLDRRALSLTLTEKGLELIEEVAPFALYYEKQAMAGLNKDEVVQLKHLLRKVFDNLEAAGRAATASKIEAKIEARNASKADASATAKGGKSPPKGKARARAVKPTPADQA
ncbi:MAG: MarR family transcriptional regulator [Rhodopseudomonas sp.]|nr:MarR family transcriptional regulator [Rhodopseudomonas sp.]